MLLTWDYDKMKCSAKVILIDEWFLSLDVWEVWKKCQVKYWSVILLNLEAVFPSSIEYIKYAMLSHDDSGSYQQMLMSYGCAMMFIGANEVHRGFFFSFLIFLTLQDYRFKLFSFLKVVEITFFWSFGYGHEKHTVLSPCLLYFINTCCLTQLLM